MLLLTDKINLSIGEEALKVKVHENDQLTTIPLEHVTTTEKSIIFPFVTLTHCSFLFLFMVKEMNDKHGGDRVYRDTDYHEKHLKIGKEIGDRAGEGQAYGYLGIACQSLGDCQKAFGYHEKDLKIAKEMVDRLDKAQPMEILVMLTSH